MNLLPFQNIEIDSPLRKSEIESSIKNNIAWTTELGMSFTKNSLREYEGFVENGTFKIRRILKSGRNSFIPIVTGTISGSGNNGSRIRLKLRLHKVVMILAIVMTLFSGIMIITSLLNSPVTNKSQKEYLIEHSIDEELAEEIVNNMEKSTKSKNMDWTSLLLFVAPYLMCTMFFNYEANIVKDKLNSILKV
jgi:hypothetical protein